MSNNGHLSPEETEEIVFLVKSYIRLATACDLEKELPVDARITHIGEAEDVPILLGYLKNDKNLNLRWSENVQRAWDEVLNDTSKVERLTVGSFITFVLHRKEKEKSAHS